MCPNCRAFISTDDRVCPYCDAKLGSKPVSRESSQSDTIAGFIPNAGFTTFVILLVNIGLYAATAIVTMKADSGSIMDIDNRVLLAFGAKFTPYIAAGQWWR